jgi:hypothetical protein
MIITPICINYNLKRTLGSKESIFQLFTLDFLPYTIFLMLVFPVSIPITFFEDKL